MAKLLATPSTVEDDDLREERCVSDSAQRPLVSRSVRIRSIAIPGIFLILTLAALKLASEFFAPVILALMLNFLFASVIRNLARLHIDPPGRCGSGPCRSRR